MLAVEQDQLGHQDKALEDIHQHNYPQTAAVEIKCSVHIFLVKIQVQDKDQVQDMEIKIAQEVHII